MKLLLGVLLMLLSVAACQLSPYQSPPPGEDPTPSSDSITPTVAHPTGEQWTDYSDNDVRLKIKIPGNWATYPSDSGIVLNERMGSVGSTVLLEGLLIHIFVPVSGDFHFPESKDVNMAWAILSQVVANPDYVGSAVVSEPVAFEWDHHDAAYYLLNNGDDTVTLLLAMGLPNTHKLIVCHVSAPTDQSDRIREMLPEILSSLTVNDHPVDPAALQALPDPLVFPRFPGDNILPQQ